MSTVLPEDVIVELLSERFQLSDCQRGIVIDGLETLFAQNFLLACTALLKAFNNRRYINCVTLKSDFHKYKEQMNKIHEEKGICFIFLQVHNGLDNFHSNFCLFFFYSNLSKRTKKEGVIGTIVYRRNGRRNLF